MTTTTTTFNLPLPSATACSCTVAILIAFETRLHKQYPHLSSVSTTLSNSVSKAAVGSTLSPRRPLGFAIVPPKASRFPDHHTVTPSFHPRFAYCPPEGRLVSLLSPRRPLGFPIVRPKAARFPYFCSVSSESLLSSLLLFSSLRFFFASLLFFSFLVTSHFASGHLTITPSFHLPFASPRASLFPLLCFFFLLFGTSSLFFSSLVTSNFASGHHTITPSFHLPFASPSLARRNARSD